MLGKLDMTRKFSTANLKPVLVLELVLLAVLLVVLAKAVLPTLAAKRLVIPASGQNLANPGMTRVKPIDSSVLHTFDPFYRDNPVSNTPITLSAPETTLDLKVFGMRADLGGDTSSAIIQTPDNKQDSYFLGDEIIPGVTLKQVEIDYVILDRSGVLERLSRQGKTADEQSAAMAMTFAAKTLNFKAADLINDVRFYPHREGRQVMGYRVRARRGGALEKYGFQPRDMITAINGESLTQNQVNLPALMKNLKQARYASIQIIRDDMPMTIEVNLQ
ncbi:MAG: hypothetical protein COA91_11905 [Robiginitomaculum sp.]|nr:MAG: hypothetical protein COA91_11905 [Robiginitomaculum sp.]